MRTADQTEIALFWMESSPLAWNRIARGVSAEQGLDLWQNARLFGLLNVALADGYVASWATKTRDARGGLDVAAAHAAGPRLRVGMRWRAPRPPRS